MITINNEMTDYDVMGTENGQLISIAIDSITDVLEALGGLLEEQETSTLKAAVTALQTARGRQDDNPAYSCECIVGKNGNSLTVPISSACAELGINKGDRVKITVKKY